MTRSPYALSGARVAGFFLLSLILTGARVDLQPGEILLQDAVSYRSEGRQLQEAGEMERASAAFRRAITLNPQYAEAFNDLGVVLETMADLVNAEKAYKEALLLKPDFAAAHSNLALLYEETGRTQEAGEHWTARIRLGAPGDPWVLRAREKMGSHRIPVLDTPKEAAEKKRQAAKLAILAGQTHMDAKRWDEAIGEFERALELEPGNAKASRYLNVTRLRAAEAARRIDREMGRSGQRVLREREIAEKERAAQEAAGRKGEAALQRDEKRKPAALPVRGKPWWKFWAASPEAARKQVEPVKKMSEFKPAAARKPWWKFWASNAEGREWAEKRQRERELEKGIERARRAQASQEEALRRAGQMMGQPAAAPVTVVPAPKPPPEVKPAWEPALAEARRLAEEYARQRVKTTEDTRDELYQRGITAIREGDYRQAAEHFRQVLLLHPNDVDAQQALARAERAWERGQQEQGPGGT